MLKTKSALHALGNYEAPSFGITEIPDKNMIDGLKSFQANNGLKVDGIMKPGGPTEKTLGQNLAQKGISTADLFAPSQPTAEPDGETDKALASINFASGKVTSLPTEKSKPNPIKRPKIDPMTGLADPLANAPKGKMPTKNTMGRGH